MGVKVKTTPTPSSGLERAVVQTLNEYWSSTIDERVVCWTEIPVSQLGNWPTHAVGVSRPKEMSQLGTWPTHAVGVSRPKERRTDTEEDGLAGQSIVSPVHGLCRRGDVPAHSVSDCYRPML